MKRSFLTTAALVAIVATGATAAGESRRLPVADYLDKMKAGWIGQMAGVGWAAPTEFKWNARIMPAGEMPEWRNETINQFSQDDIYVEMTFLRSLEQHGIDVGIRQAGIDFANSGYRLWHANKAGRDNLRRGIAPPDSGHPRFNQHADDIDYQIEADFSGLISPGLPSRVIRLGEVFGRLMNYGDGVYGGQFVGAMYAEAFFESDRVKLVEAGLAAIPEDSQYHQCISDVLGWYREDPDDWEKTWHLVEEKYRRPEFTRFLCQPGSHIDAKHNGAYIVMGMLFGGGDPDRTITIATRCGRDSDCNPSNAAGVLFTTMGFGQLPGRFTAALDPERKFSHTPYGFASLCDVCEQLARRIVVAEGGRIEKDADGAEVFVIPADEPDPGPAAKSWEPGPVANAKFTEAELGRITAKPE
jgi:hypothetical protein